MWVIFAKSLVLSGNESHPDTSRMSSLRQLIQHLKDTKMKIYSALSTNNLRPPKKTHNVIKFKMFSDFSQTLLCHHTSCWTNKQGVNKETNTWRAWMHDWNHMERKDTSVGNLKTLWQTAHPTQYNPEFSVAFWSFDLTVLWVKLKILCQEWSEALQ